MLFCGIDFGTTNTKAVLLDEAMELRGAVTFPVGLQECPGRLSAQVWLDHFYRVLEYFQDADMIKKEKVVLSIAAQGGSFVLLDGQFEPISPAYSWLGLAKESTVADLVRTFGRDRFYHKTGFEPGGWLMACKLKEWLAEAGSERSRVAKVTTVPDFIHGRLTGRAVTDITNAQITGMFDFNMGRWDRDILDWIGCEPGWLPEVLDRAVIFEDGLSVRGVELSLVTGSHDQYAAMRAAGVAAEGQFMLGTGTAWVLNGKSREPLYDETHFKIHPGRDLIGEDFGYIATLGAVGNGFDLLLGRLGISHDRLAKMEGDLAGVGLPRTAVNADINQGAVEGDCETDELAIRRYMEAAGAKVRFLLEKLADVRKAEKIVMTGGAVGSGLWPAIVAGICNLPVEAVTFNELTAYGAALYAGMAAGRSVSAGWPEGVRVRRFEPCDFQEYEQWYQEHQKPMLERENSR
jgi:sugar (pentulose or hexulose) kinase